MGSTTADIMDGSNGAYQSCTTQLCSFGGREEFAGTIRTVRCDNDTVLVKRVLAEPGEGMVLVIDGGGSLESALLGDRTASEAASKGWAGVVINGVLRDTEALRHVPLGIKAIGTNPRKPRQDGVGEIDVEVTFGGVTFRPGESIWSDADGVVTTPR